MRNDSNLAYIVVWVDDIIIAANSIELLDELKNELKNTFKMKDLGKISYFLGIQFNQIEGGISMDQSHYLQNVLKRNGMEMCKPRTTPCDMKLDCFDNDVDEDEEKGERKYREIVGSLVYAMTCTRPDLSWIVTKLSQHLSCPTKADWVIVKQILRYIRGTLNYKLTFTKSKTEKVNLVGYSDADWASSVEDRKSTTGYLFYMNEEGPAISWKSKKQSTIALSSCEAEYMALTACTQEAMFLKMLLSEFEEQPNQCTPIYEDNQGAIALNKEQIGYL